MRYIELILNVLDAFVCEVNAEVIFLIITFEIIRVTGMLSFPPS